MALFNAKCVELKDYHRVGDFRLVGFCYSPKFNLPETNQRAECKMSATRFLMTTFLSQSIYAFGWRSGWITKELWSEIATIS